jgi:hypothetical protein
MLKDAIEKISELCIAAASVQSYHPPGEAEHVYYLRHGETLQRVEREPKPRRHVAYDAETLLRFCAGFAANRGEELADGGESPGIHVAVWYSREGVTAYLDDSTRRDTVAITLAPSPQMKLLFDWDIRPTWMKQPEIIRTLRVKLAGSVSPAGVVEALRRLRFRQSQAGETVVEHGQSSIGRNIMAELANAQTVPEEVVITVPAFADGFGGIDVSVRCAVEIDLENQAFAIMPLAGQLADAWNMAEESVGGSLREVLDALNDDRDDGDYLPISLYRGRP